MSPQVPFSFPVKIYVLQEPLNSVPRLEQTSGTGPEVDCSGGAPACSCEGHHLCTLPVISQSHTCVPIQTAPGCSSVDEEGHSSASARSIDSPLFLSADPEQPDATETWAETRIVDKEGAFTSGTQVCPLIHKDPRDKYLISFSPVRQVR